MEAMKYEMLDEIERMTHGLLRLASLRPIRNKSIGRSYHAVVLSS